ncbi:MAG: hypothetical protein K0S82_80 [Gaiellaceae bacterium]|jgi:hypothetical protein|nr:hypothetical protein [Gaiellaceae bacterium]
MRKRILATIFVAAVLSATAAQAQNVKTFKVQPYPGPTAYSAGVSLAQ